MKSSTKKIICIFLCSILLMFTISVFKIREYGCAAVLLITLIFSILFLGYNKNRESNEKNIILSVTLFTFFYQIFIFLIFGATVGFLESGYKFGFNYVFKLILPLLLVIILSEVLRYQLIEKGKKNKYIIIATTFYFIYVDIILNYGFYDLSAFKGWFELLSFIIFPSIVKNIYLSYNSYYYGYKSTIIYRVLMEMTKYILPIVPNIGEYLECIFNIIYPFVLLLYVNNYTSNMIINSKAKKENNNDKNKKIVYVIILAIVIVYALFMSGLFKYYFLAVGSSSMEPNIEVGDMIIVEKTKEYNKLKVDDVLVYKKDDVVVLHRIIKITHEDGKYIFKTKGDNNTTADNWEVNESEVIGKTNLRLKKAGYPTLWLNKLFKGGK